MTGTVGSAVAHAIMKMLPTATQAMAQVRMLEFIPSEARERVPSRRRGTSPGVSTCDVLRRFHDLVHRNAQMFVDLLIRRARSESRKSEDDAVRAHPLIPRHRMRRLD